jgi:multidrug efflux pump subunit AcrA (membrane-fusion protein)
VASARLESARAKLRAVSAGVDAAQAGLAESQTMLGYAQLTAPFSGRVIERRVDPGSLASPGAVILVLEEDGPLRVEASVDESRGGAIVLGDLATIELEAPVGNVEGTVGEIVPSVDVASRAFLVKVDFTACQEALRGPGTACGPSGFKTPPPGLRPGMFARVAFRLGKRSPLVVPTSSLSAMGALDRVFVVDKEHAHLRIVTLGEPQGPWTEILSGLDVGELVVVEPSSSVVDGAPVKVTP